MPALYISCHIITYNGKDTKILCIVKRQAWVQGTCTASRMCKIACPKKEYGKHQKKMRSIQQVTCTVASAGMDGCKESPVTAAMGKGKEPATQESLGCNTTKSKGPSQAPDGPPIKTGMYVMQANQARWSSMTVS